MAGSPLYAPEGRQSHTDDALEEEALFNGSVLSPLLAQVKGGARTGKQCSVAQILLLYWATAALDMPHQALGP